MVSVCAAGIEEILSRPPVCPQFGNRERLLNAQIVELVSRLHYSPKQQTPALSAQWYLEYFKVLDPQKILFLDTDLAEFRSYENVLFNKQNMMIRLAFVNRVYLRLLSRTKQYAEYSIRLLDEPMDYSVKEYVEFDRKDAAWCHTEDELHELWRLRVKNSLLADRIIEEAEAKAKEENGDEKTAEPSTFKRPPVKERLAKQFAQTYERRLDATALEILEVFLNAYTHMFDPHTDYMAPDSEEDFNIHLRLSLQGIGATLSLKDSYCEIISLVPGGPADKEGTLKEGDRIVEVCQEGGEPVNVIDMPLKKTVKQIRGPKGTAVTLTILEAGSGATRHVRIVRDDVKLQDSEASSEVKEITLKDGRVARVLVLYLPSFYADFQARSKGNKKYKSSSRDVRNLLAAGVKDGRIDSVVLDFRGNGGGSLEDAIALAGLFFNKGPVVQVRWSGGEIRSLQDPDGSCLYDGPLFVMVDKNSASASEIVAAALQDMGRAIVVGTDMTHGKGTVQKPIDLNNVFMRRTAAGLKKAEDGFGMLKITFQKFYRINGASTQLKGVHSDIVFPSYQDSMETGESKIPFALAWDEISSSSFTKFPGFEAILPKLRTASEEHRTASEAYREYLKDIADYDELAKNKKTPLNYEERKAYYERSEEIIKKLRQFMKQTKAARKRVRNKEEKKDDVDDNACDVIMDETLYIIGTYLDMAAAKQAEQP